jgi:hypothetical protein
MGGMNTPKPIQIFKAGKHTAMSGAALSFSEADLVATAKAYDPAKHEAPIVIGHPAHDGPAYGWVKSLKFADGLEAEPQQVNEAFADMVARGAFKKISASFYTPDSPSNPVPGVYYLRHVGFLGAQPPAVKGLRNPAFADSEKGVIEFADYDDVLNASLWRRLRDWMIGEKGLDVADNIIPDYQVSSLEQMAQQEDEDAETDSAGTVPACTSYSEKTQSKGDEMSVEDKARLAELEAQNKALLAEKTTFAEAEKKSKAAARHAVNVAFAESLAKEGKLLPAHKGVTVAALNFIESAETVVEFGEGDARKPLGSTYKAALLALPKLVEFKEVATGKDIVIGADMDPTAVAKAAVEFQESEAAAGRVVNAAQAVQHVQAKTAKV